MCNTSYLASPTSASNPYLRFLLNNFQRYRILLFFRPLLPFISLWSVHLSPSLPFHPPSISLLVQRILDSRDLPARLGIMDPPPSHLVRLPSSPPWLPVCASIPPTSRGTPCLRVSSCFSLFFAYFFFPGLVLFLLLVLQTRSVCASDSHAIVVVLY